MSNPYAPPQTAETVRSPRTANGSITVLSLALVTLWGTFASVVSFFGRYVSMSTAAANVFGFSGMGLCLLGLPIIAALAIRSSANNSTLKCWCILDVFGMFVFVAAVRMQAGRGLSFSNWLMLAAMVCGTTVISLLIAIILNWLRRKNAA